MKRILSLISFALIHNLNAQLNYPTSHTVDSSDTFFGIKYPDPYRWLEKMDDPKVASWFKAQSDYSNSMLKKISGIDSLTSDFEKLSKLKSVSYKERRASKTHIFYLKTMQGEKVPKLYRKSKLTKKEELILDPSASLGNSITIQGAFPSHDGNKVVLSYYQNGSEISTLKVYDLEKKQFLSDSLYPCLGTIFWSGDNKSFIYTSLVTADNNSEKFLKNNKVKLHILGTNNLNDNIYLGNESYPELKLERHNFVNGEISTSSPDYIFSSISNDDGLHIKYVASSKDLYEKHINWQVLSKRDDQLIKVTEFIGDRVYSISNKNAPNCKLIATSIAKPNWNEPEIIASEKKNLVLEDFNICKDFLVLTYSEGLKCRLFKYNFKTKQTSEITLPYSAMLDAWCTDRSTNECFIKLRSWNKPPTEYKLDVSSNTFNISEFNISPNYPTEFKNIEVEEVEVKGHDGVTIPLSIIYRKGAKKDGANYCLIDGYGAYGYSEHPYYNTAHISLASKGIIIAIAHVRGGGEKGEEWRLGGFKTTKPNTWKDLNSCAEFLITQRYTSRKKVIATSGSAGGVMVSRAITERPDLYGAAICISGVVNTMRLEKMPNGPNCAFEFGTTKDSLECRGLYAMDGVAHVKANTDYPAIICVTGINDPRVSPWQSAKLVAAFQNRNKAPKPTLLMVNYENGHFNRDRDYASQIAFALWQCGHPDYKLVQ